MMIGILMVTHAPLGNAFMSVVHHIYRHTPAQLEAIDVLPDQNPSDIVERIKEAISRLNTGQGVLVLTDITGATPTNCCQQLAPSDQVAMVAGLNLPMLLRTLTYRHKNLTEIVEIAQVGGQNGVTQL